MAAVIYGLCGILACATAWLLLRGYGRSGYRLLFWSGLYFALSTLNNGFLMLDKLVVETDLSLWRAGLALVATMLLLIGLIRNGE
ncbi:MAG: conserved rane protein of unknown function [Nitrospira sp.]|nr:conserved rane protein of unknown function [Nitrospira sp.]